MWLAASSFDVPEGVLATLANQQLNPKPHQGLPSKNAAPHPALDDAKSTVALGLRASLLLNGARQSERARYYGSALGRFTSPDNGVDQNAEDPQSWNLYSYVRNNPLSNVDPDGRTCSHSKDTQGRDVITNTDGKGCDELYDNNVYAFGGNAGLAVLASVGEKTTNWREWVDVTRHGVEGAMYAAGVKDLAEGALTLADWLKGARDARKLANLSGLLRDALKGKGNFGLGTGTAEDAEELGKAWVGEGATTASDGKTLVSADKLRQYRPPSFKPNLGKAQANFEARWEPGGQWQTNGHLDIK